MPQRGMIAERYAPGATMAELAKDFEVGEATIWRALGSTSQRRGDDCVTTDKSAASLF
jgi:transposase-like protein